MSYPVVLITGAGSGIGFATAERFISSGWNVLAVGRRLQKLSLLTEKYGSRVITYACDLTKSSEVEGLIDTVKAQSEPLRALINCAGVFERSRFEESDDALWERQYTANLLAPVRITRGLLPIFRAGGGGCIVNVSSTLGRRPAGPTAAYSAMKAAMISWTKSLALEVASDQIRVNCICPGIVETPIHASLLTGPDGAETRKNMNQMQPLGRIGQPCEVAHSILHFCAPGSEWMTGSILNVDGGISL